MKKIFIFVLIFTSFSFAQHIDIINGISRDTSYTLYSASKKMLKKFPDAKLVTRNLPQNIQEKSNLVYAKIGKREIHLNIFYPINSKKNLPSVLMIYGGGWRSGDTSLIIPMAERLAAKGFVTVTPEYRLSPEALFPAAVLDLKAAVRWIRANADKYNIDKNKIAAYGCSAGGQLAALLGTTNGNAKFEGGNEGNKKFSSDIQAIIDVDGVVDFFGKGSEEVKNNADKPGAAHLWFGVSAKENPQVWKEAGAINYTNKKTPPIVFINSAVQRFHAGRDEMIQLLKKYKIYYEVHTFPNTIHTFWLFHPWFEKTLDYTSNFLNKVFY